MKKLFKRNQIIVTVLAIMIAVAGYLNYADNKTNSDVQEANVDTTYTDEDIYYDLDDLLTSDGDIESLDGEEELLASENENSGSEESDIENVAEADSVLDAANTETTDTDEETDTGSEENAETPGTAVLTSISTDNTFILEAKLNREQTRSKNKASLLEIINSENISDDLKADAVASMVALTERSELENTIETLLEAKGFDEVVVTISEYSADIVLDMTDITDEQRAQIEDVVKRKTDFTADAIVITPVSTED